MSSVLITLKQSAPNGALYTLSYTLRRLINTATKPEKNKKNIEGSDTTLALLNAKSPYK